MAKDLGVSPTIPEAGPRLASLKRLWPYIRPYRGLVLLTVVGALGATLVQIAIPLITQDVIDGPIADRDKSGLIPLGLLALAFGVAEAFLFFLRRWAMTKSSLAMERDLRDHMYSHLLSLPVAFHDRWSSGQLLSRASSDVSSIRRFVGFSAIFLVVNIVSCIVIMILLIGIYWPLGIFSAVAAIPLIYVGVRFERRYNVVSRQVQDQQGEAATDVEESVLGIRIIKALGRRDLVFGRFDAKAVRLQGLELGKIKLLAFIWAIFELQPQLVLAGVLVGGSFAVAGGAMTLGTLVSFIALFTVMVWPILSIGWLLASTLEAATAADRIFELLDAEPTILDPHDGREQRLGPGRLRLEGVGFSYPDASAPVLHDVDLEITPGETVALVGATGSGKTTLTALVPRLYDVTAGRITIDGVDIRELPVSQLRSQVATAFEDATLFSMSARENLALGRPDATDAEVAEAIDIAQAAFVYDLPWGLDTRLGEQGMSLSGGQRQRLALARAVLGRPTVLVLDDPLSALDVHTESLVEEALRRVLVGTTALVVAHRPSTVLLADRVALLDGGTITHMGLHSDLLATVPAYRSILSAETDEDGVLPTARQMQDEGAGR
ncbi:MAG: ABC transporter ATP-binding protein [Geodermatophilaceae bacterium]|jgi:ATP-binding cassette subfamily B protein|nr:ABC transporter ATP-binding protein [Geodermatophilaceae bacterium]